MVSCGTIFFAVETAIASFFFVSAKATGLITGTFTTGTFTTGTFTTATGLITSSTGSSVISVVTDPSTTAVPNSWLRSPMML